MKQPMDLCSVTGCTNRRYVRGMCSKHYQRFLAHGDADGGAWEHFKNESDAFMSRVIKSANGCWTWAGALNGNGYGVFRFRGSRMLAHRASVKLFTSGLNKRLQVNHKCDNPKCVNPAHLYQGTQKQNIADMIVRTRINRKGDRAHFRKLDSSQVVAIRSSINTSKIELANKFGVSKQTIVDILNRKSWRHI